MRISEVTYGSDQLYVRFGEPPEGGKSRVWGAPNWYVAGRVGQDEAGLSVYPIEWDAEMARYDIICHNAASLDELLSQKRTAYMLTGVEHADEEGIDGEPLLIKFNVVRKMEYHELFYWGWKEGPMPEEYLEWDDDDDDQ